MKMIKILVPLLIILVILPYLQARRENLKKVLAHKDDDGEELDFGEGYVASTSLYKQNDGGKEDIEFEEGYVVGLSESGEAFSNENPFYQFNQLSAGSDTKACVNCRVLICKVRLVFMDKCYVCKYINQFCIAEALCKLIGTII